MGAFAGAEASRLRGGRGGGMILFSREENKDAVAVTTRRSRR
jgi:hypothetical protein